MRPNTGWRRPGGAGRWRMWQRRAGDEEALGGLEGRRGWRGGGRTRAEVGGEAVPGQIGGVEPDGLNTGGNCESLEICSCH